MGAFEYFHNFMIRCITLMTTAPICYIFYTVFVIWVFVLFFRMIGR